MNNHTMLEELEIVNNRVLKMLNSSNVNDEVFYADVRTLTKLVEEKLDSLKKNGGK